MATGPIETHLHHSFNWENGAPGAREGPRGRSVNCGSEPSAQCVRLRSEINRDIPYDYAGNMGVPINVLDDFNPDQFEIVGLGEGRLGQETGIGDIQPEHRAIMTKHAAAGDLYYLEDGKPKFPYARIVIRNKHPEEPKQ